MNSDYTQPVNITLKVKLASQLIENHSAASPYVVGEELARHVAIYVQNHHTGYYPAVDYFHELGIIDTDLFTALENVSWLVTSMSKDILRTGLRTYLRNIQFDSTQMIATTLPQIRPGSKNAMHRLALHYTPDQIRINLLADLIQSENIKTQDKLQKAKENISMWLDGKFLHSEVCDFWYREDTNKDDVV